MADIEKSTKYRLGQALVELDKDHNFLSQNKNKDFSLQEKSDLIKGIVSEKLEYGKINDIVEMVYGGFGSANLLYDENKNKLNNEIVKSMRAKEKSIDSLYDDSVRTLKEKSDGSLLFKMGVASSTYKQFGKKVNLDSDFFKDEEKGEIRKRIYEKVLAGKALKESNIGNAVSHFANINASDRIDNLFEEYAYEGNGLVLKQMALHGSPDKRDSRLKRLITGNKLDAVESYNILNTLKFCKITLTEKQREKLFDRLAKEDDLFSEYTLKNKLGLHQRYEQREFKDEMRLRWAKHHIKENPYKTYNIFISEKEKGKDLDREIIESVVAGLELNRSKNEYQKEKGLRVDDIDVDYLEQVYSNMDFETRVDISRHLGDKKKRKELSREANKAGNFERAYNLWFEADGGQGEYLGSLREKLIDKILNKKGSFWEINNNDLIGKELLFGKAIKRNGLGEDVYKLAWEMKDEQKLELAREKLLKEYKIWYVFDKFMKPDYHKEERDEEGLKLIKEGLSTKYSLNVGELESLLE